jgi:hypothetical protein
MKDREHKPKKPHKAGGKHGKLVALAVIAEQGAPAHGEVLEAAREVSPSKKDRQKVTSDPPGSVESREQPVRLAARSRFSVSTSSFFDMDVDSDLDSEDQTDHDQPREYEIWEESFEWEASSQPENLLEYFAEEEVEAAMREADVAMQADESAFMFEEGIGAYDLTPDGELIGWAERGAESAALEENSLDIFSS